MGLSKTLKNIFEDVSDSAKALSQKTRKEVQNIVEDTKVFMKRNNYMPGDIEGNVSEAYSKYRNSKNLWKHQQYEKGDSLLSAAVFVEDGIEQGIVGAANLAYKPTKWAAKKTFKKPVKDENKFLGYDIGLTKTGTAVGVGLGFGIPLTLAVGGQLERDNIGEVEAGLPSRTVNETFAPIVARQTDSAMDGAMPMKDFNKRFMRDNYSSRLAGVNPDIVFAMHELRNNGEILNNERVR